MVSVCGGGVAPAAAAAVDGGSLCGVDDHGGATHVKCC